MRLLYSADWFCEVAVNTMKFSCIRLPCFIWVFWFLHIFRASMPASNETQFSGREFREYFKNWIIRFFNLYVAHVNAPYICRHREGTHTGNNVMAPHPDSLTRDWVWVCLCARHRCRRDLVVSIRFGGWWRAKWEKVSVCAHCHSFGRCIVVGVHVHVRPCENNYKSLFPIVKCKWRVDKTIRFKFERNRCVIWWNPNDLWPVISCRAAYSSLTAAAALIPNVYCAFVVVVVFVAAGIHRRPVFIMWHGPHHMIYIDFDFDWWQCNAISATVCLCMCELWSARTTQSAFIEEERFYFPPSSRRRCFWGIFYWLGSTMETTNSNFRINFTMTIDDRPIDAFNFRIDFDVNRDAFGRCAGIDATQHAPSK